tara:strand:+ start:1847 stop:2257 length:411 start_codon:yes stop_codon:yes gene_type:complete
MVVKGEGESEYYGYLIVEEMVVSDESFLSVLDLSLDREGDFYLNLGGAVYSLGGDGDDFGNPLIPIKRVGAGRTDYEIDLRGVKYRWTPEREPFYSRGCDIHEEDIVQLDYEMVEVIRESAMLRKTIDSLEFGEKS